MGKCSKSIVYFFKFRFGDGNSFNDRTDLNPHFGIYTWLYVRKTGFSYLINHRQTGYWIPLRYQGFYSFSETNFKKFFRTSNFTFNPVIPKISKSIQNQFSQWSTYISYNLGSENFIAWVKQISRTF